MLAHVSAEAMWSEDGAAVSQSISRVKLSLIKRSLLSVKLIAFRDARKGQVEMW